MQAPRQSGHPVDTLNCLRGTGANRRLGSYPIRTILLLMLMPMLVAWTTVWARAEVSENSAQISAPVQVADTAGEYRLTQGDRLKIVVFDQEQLSGDFIVDGTGGILLPLAGRVSVAGLTVSEAQQLIQNRLADGVLVQPSVSVRMPEYRPIFVTGDVKKPGSYPFMFGLSVKAAIATAGGEGLAIELPMSVAMSDFIGAEERVRQLEMNRIGLRVRTARLEAQRDGQENFVMPQLVGLNPGPVDPRLVYAAENNTFVGLVEAYYGQVQTLQRQRPRIEAEVQAVTDQIAKEKERLDIVNDRLADLEQLFNKGLLRKELLINQRIERALVEAQLARLAADVARLRQTMGDLDVKIEEVKAAYKRQIMAELQETSQRLRETETTISTARKLRDVRAEYVNISTSDSDYTIRINRTEGSGTVTFNADNQTALQPGDVIDVKLKRRAPSDLWSSPTESVRTDSSETGTVGVTASSR